MSAVIPAESEPPAVKAVAPRQVLVRTCKEATLGVIGVMQAHQVDAGAAATAADVLGRTFRRNLAMLDGPPLPQPAPGSGLIGLVHALEQLE